MSVFPDEDLKHLKEHADSLEKWKIHYKTKKEMAVIDLKALLARLEAAEACIKEAKELGLICCEEVCCKEMAYAQWSKACGK